MSKVSDRVIRREGEIRGAGTGKEEEKIKPVLSADDKIMYLKKKKRTQIKTKTMKKKGKENALKWHFTKFKDRSGLVLLESCSDFSCSFG